MAAKFTMANPGSIFGAGDHMEASSRMEQAMEDLRIKHEYEEKIKIMQEEKEAEKERYQQRKKVIQTGIKDKTYEQPPQENEDDPVGENDEESSDEDWLEDDQELDRLRSLRLQQLKNAYQSKQENIAKGHGQYREIVQDEFLPEVTSSKYVAVHFYHRDFERCKIIDKHISLIAPHHLECKFLKLNAENAPFFVEKLRIRVLPSIICFEDGVAMQERVLGFDGLSDHMLKGKEDEFKTGELARRLAEIGVIKCSDVFDGEDEDDNTVSTTASIRMSTHVQGYTSD